MELIFSAIFVAAVRIVAPVVLFLTEKVKDLFKLTTKQAGYAFSLVISALISILFKFLGPSIVYALLALVPGWPGGQIPQIPENVGWGWYIIFTIVLWLTAGGIYDFEKKKKSV